MSSSEIDREKQERIKLLTSPESDIESIIQRACKSGIYHKERITIGYSNEVYAVTTDNGDEVIVRIHWYESPYFENEKWALERLANSSLPIPQVICLMQDLPGDIPRAACVETRLVGESLETIIASGAISSAELHPILYDLGKLLRKVHAMPMRGFGSIKANGRGEALTWQEAYVAALPEERAYEAARHVGLPDKIVSEAINLLTEFAVLGDDVQPCLLHGDFNLQNVLVLNGQITGLIDFEFCQSGDAAKEVPLGKRDSGGWNQFFGRQPIPSEWILEGYLEEKSTDKTFTQRVMWFCLANSLNGFAYHGVNDKDNERFTKFLRQQLPRDLTNVLEYFNAQERMY